MFETALQILVPYMGWGIVILVVMFILDVILSAEKDHGIEDLLRQAKNIGKDVDTFKVKRSASKARAKLFCFLVGWPFVALWWLKITYEGKQTFVERLLVKVKKKIEEKKGET